MSLQDIMSAAGLGSWAEVGLIVSFVTFVAIVLWVVLRRKDRWNDVRDLPLADDDGVSEGSRGAQR